MLNKVIIIDDSLFDCNLIEKVVSKYSFAAQVICFNNAKDALAYLHSVKNDPDEFPGMIFLDIYMPIMSGFEFLDKYMELPAKAVDHCVVIMISSTFKAEDSERMNKYPVIKKFLYKPFSVRMLAELQELYASHC